MIFKVYLGITITTIIISLSAVIRVYFNKNLMAEIKNGGVKNPGDSKYITYMKFILLNVLPVVQLLCLFGMACVLFADEKTAIKITKKA